MTKELFFRTDTKHRKDYFTGMSFSHPAKMSLPLQLWLIDNFTKPGDTILDPMGGSGTILVACSMGRHVICVELEQKFVDMMKGNWEKIQQRGPQMGYSMGTATILQGDSRQLTTLLKGQVGAIVTSPPYAEGAGHGGQPTQAGIEKGQQGLGQSGHLYGTTNGNIGNLPYGDISAIISSPPYAEATHHTDDPEDTEKLRPGRSSRLSGTSGYHGSPSQRIGGTAGDSEGQIGQLPYNPIDCILTSPPYEASVSDGKEGPSAGGNERKGQPKSRSTPPIDCVISSPPYEGQMHPNSNDEGEVRKLGDNYGSNSQPILGIKGYGDSKDNIGNLKSDNYLTAMRAVYAECWKVLKPDGIMALVLKNFIRDQKLVRLDLDTTRIVESVGFRLVETLKRRLPAQSFWRILYQRKFPDVEPITHEDVLVFRKSAVQGKL